MLATRRGGGRGATSSKLCLGDDISAPLGQYRTRRGRGSRQPPTGIRHRDQLNVRWSDQGTHRLALLLATVAGWAGLLMGALLGQRAIVVAAALVVAATNLVMTRLLLATRSALAAATHRWRNGWSELDGTLRDAAEVTRSEAEKSRNEVKDLAERTAGELAALRQITDAQRNEARDVAERTSGRLDDLHQSTDDQRAAISRLDHDHSATRLALLEARSLIEKFVKRLPAAPTYDQPSEPPNDTVPLLSIAIPSFNRPDRLQVCLASIESEIESADDGEIEICITDDASIDPETMDVALEFCRHRPEATLRRNPSNLGLERNLIAACQPCRGDYVLILGNDDGIVPGALRTILDDLRAIGAPVHLYEKGRIALDGAPLPAIAGSSPAELAPGEGFLFASVQDAARRQGYLSTFGFISQIMFRRQPFLAVDPAPYLGLTMYPQVFVLVEAFGDQPVFYRNDEIVLHRSPTQAQKLAEALGRSEERFMNGGEPKLACYFGTTLAASWQRLIDRRSIDLLDVARGPEQLWAKKSLAEWMTANRAIDPALDESLDDHVVRDADRFFAALRAGAQ